MSFIYVLQHATEPRIKIGYSVNPFSRSLLLPDEIDYARSLQMPVERRWVGRIERTLHFVAREFAVRPDHAGQGFTEWFDDEALPVIVAFVDRNPDMFPDGGFSALERPEYAWASDSDSAEARAVRLFVAAYSGRLRYSSGNRRWYEWNPSHRWWGKLSSVRVQDYLFSVARVDGEPLLRSAGELNSAMNVVKTHPAFWVAETPPCLPDRRKAIRLSRRTKLKPAEAAWYEDFQRRQA